MAFHDIGPLEVRGDLAEMSLTRLRALFGRAEPGQRVVLRQLIRSAVLQIARENRLARERGEEPAFQGHGRALWHHLPEVLVRRLPPAEQGADAYETLTRVLSDMVFERRLLTYSELELTDHCWEERRIGAERPDVLVVAEKRSYFRLLRRVHEATGVSVCVTAGYPSGVTCEYTARDVGEALARARLEPRVRVFGLVDFDPSGWDIMDVFCRHVTRAGLACGDWRPVFDPSAVAPERLPLVSLPISTRGRREALLRRWMARSGGVHGRPLRVELEAVRPAALEQLLLREVTDG